MKTVIFISSSVFGQAESLARQLGLSSSELYTKALKAYLKRYDQTLIRDKLNQVYFQEPSKLDPVMARMQWMTLPREEW